MTAEAPQLQSNYWIIRDQATGIVLSAYQQGPGPKVYVSRKSAERALRQISACDTSTCSIEKIAVRVVPETTP